MYSFICYLFWQKPGPGEHPLQFNYSIWYSRRTPGNKAATYDQNLKFVASFASVSTVQSFHFYFSSFYNTLINTIKCHFERLHIFMFYTVCIFSNLNNVQDTAKIQ